MDGIRWSVRLAAFAAVALLVAVLAVSTLERHEAAAASPLLDSKGAPMAVPDAVGTFHATWDGEPVLVRAVPASILDGVDAVRGAGTSTPSVAADQFGLRVVAVYGKSIASGCTLGFNADLGGSKDVADYNHDGVPDGRLMDPCWQGQWDLFHDGAPQPGSPAPARQPALHLVASGGFLYATGFDGPTTIWHCGGCPQPR